MPANAEPVHSRASAGDTPATLAGFGLGSGAGAGGGASSASIAASIAFASSRNAAASASKSSDVAAARSSPRSRGGPLAGRRAVLCMVSMKAAAKAAIGCMVKSLRSLRSLQLLAAMPAATNTRRMSSSDRLHDSLRLFELKISIWLELELG